MDKLSERKQVLNLWSRGFCAHSLCIISLGKETGPHLSARAAGPKFRKKPCTKPPLLSISAEVIWSFAIPISGALNQCLRKCQSARDNKDLSQDEVTSSGHANGIDVLEAQGMSHGYTWLSWAPHSISRSPGHPYSYPTLLKVKFLVSTTNIWSGFVSPQGYSIMHSGI